MLGAILAWWWVGGVVAAQEGAVVVPDASAMEVDASAGPLVEAAYSALADGRFAEAARAFGALADAGAGPVARYLHAMCWYEAGDLRAAARAVVGVELPSARNLDGLIRLDAGDQAGGMAVLRSIDRAADPALGARVALNLGLAHIDRGETRAAEAVLSEALDLARSVGDDALERAVASNLAVVANLEGQPATTAPSGADAVLLGVGEALRRGQPGAAREALGSGPAGTDRERVAWELAAGALARAEGRLEDARRHLERALAVARQGGMARETAYALVSLGVTHSVAGRSALALELLEEAAAAAEDGGYRVLAVDARTEQGHVAVRTGDVARARAQLEAARQGAAGMQVPATQARLAELAGALAGAEGDPVGASAAYQDALRAYEARGWTADAARVATGLVGATTASGQAELWVKRAHELFRKAGDPVGPAHVALAEGLAWVRAEELDRALERFAAAVQAARAAGPAGASVASVAQANAAQALVVLGASPEAARRAASAGLDGLEGAVAHHERLVAAMADYDAGRQAFDGRRYAEAERRFREAETALRALGEEDYARRARLARLWAGANLALGRPAAEALPALGHLQSEASQTDDVELQVRLAVGASLAAWELGHDDPGPKVVAAAELAEARGFPDLAARCRAALAEGPEPLEQRAGHARSAYHLAPTASAAVYAMYAVAVDAYNAGELELAAALAGEVLPKAGALEQAVRGVLDAVAAAGP